MKCVHCKKEGLHEKQRLSCGDTVFLCVFCARKFKTTEKERREFNALWQLWAGVKGHTREGNNANQTARLRLKKPA